MEAERSVGSEKVESRVQKAEQGTASHGAGLSDYSDKDYKDSMKSRKMLAKLKRRK